MSLLGFLAWGLFGGMYAKDELGKKGYNDARQQEAKKNGSPVFMDKMGRTYSTETGKLVTETHDKLTGRKAYADAITGETVIDHTVDKWTQRRIDSLEKMECEFKENWENYNCVYTGFYSKKYWQNDGWGCSKPFEERTSKEDILRVLAEKENVFRFKIIDTGLLFYIAFDENINGYSIQWKEDDGSWHYKPINEKAIAKLILQNKKEWLWSGTMFAAQIHPREWLDQFDPKTRNNPKEIYSQYPMWL